MRKLALSSTIARREERRAYRHPLVELRLAGGARVDAGRRRRCAGCRRTLGLEEPLQGRVRAGTRKAVGAEPA
jgi:hypothetical protein